MAVHNWIIDMREVFLAFGVLLLIYSYFKDGFDFLGYYFVFGVMIIIFSMILYVIKFLDKFD